MPSYVEQTLTSGERITYQAKISLWSLMPLILLGVLTLPIMIGVVLLALAAIRYLTTELAITNKRLIAKFGFISRRTIEISLQKTESLRVDQSILGRLCNYGTIVVAGAGNPQAPIPGISRPLVFRQEFLRAQESAAARPAVTE